MLDIAKNLRQNCSMTFTPADLAAHRTARLVREAAAPTRVYSTDTASAVRDERIRRIRWSEEYTGPEFCFVCGRPTDHGSEHDDEQLLAFYSGKGRFFRR